MWLISSYRTAIWKHYSLNNVHYAYEGHAPKIMILHIFSMGNLLIFAYNRVKLYTHFVIYKISVGFY